jgi:O-antigen ligase
MAVVVLAVVSLGAQLDTIARKDRAHHLNLVGAVAARLGSLADPNEPTSNAPRLHLYGAVARVIGDHPALGVGPGNVGYVLPRYGQEVPHRKVYVATANDIWLQGAVDAGVLAIPLIVGLLWGTAQAVRRRSSLPARALALGGLVFLLVNGAFVSLLWDMKFWTVFALAVAIHRSSLAEAQRHEVGRPGELIELTERTSLDRVPPMPLPR